MPLHKSIIPREGFYADVVFKLIDRTLLNPNLLLPLILLARYTKRGENLSILHARSFSRLRKLFYLSLVRNLIRYLSDKSRNNWSKDRYDWSREIVVVTGGSSGIGASMVKLFDEMGVKVVVLDINPLPFRSPSGRVRHYTCDVRLPETVKAVADQIRADVGHPTVLINNAGIFHGKSIVDATPSDVRLTFDINTFAHYWLAHAFLPHMIARNHGMVVTVASLAGHITSPNMVDYGASKAAAISFHEGLSSELKMVHKAPKVRTVLVQTGHIKTPLFAGFHQKNDFLSPSLEPDSIADAIVRQVLSGRSGNIILPLAGSLTALTRMFPAFMANAMRNRTAEYVKGWNARDIIKQRQDAMANEKSQDTSESTVLVE